MAELTNFGAAFHGRIGSDRSNRLHRDWLRFRTRKMLKESGVSHEDMVHTSRWVAAVERMDAMKEEGDAGGEWNRIFDRVEAEIKEGEQAGGGQPPPRIESGAFDG